MTEEAEAKNKLDRIECGWTELRLSNGKSILYRGGGKFIIVDGFWNIINKKLAVELVQHVLENGGSALPIP